MLCRCGQSIPHLRLLGPNSTSALSPRRLHRHPSIHRAPSSLRLHLSRASTRHWPQDSAPPAAPRRSVPPAPLGSFPPPASSTLGLSCSGSAADLGRQSHHTSHVRVSFCVPCVDLPFVFDIIKDTFGYPRLRVPSGSVTWQSHVTADWFSPVSVANELAAQHSNS